MLPNAATPALGRARRRLCSYATCLTLASTLASCGPTIVDPPSVETVSVSPGTQVLESVGESVRLSATATDSDGSPIADATFSWSSSNETAVTVSADGLATAVGEGSSTITATSGGVSGESFLSVRQRVVSVEIGFLEDDGAFQPRDAWDLGVGDSTQAVVQVLDARDNSVTDSTVEWMSTTPDVFTVSVDGWLRAVAVDDSTTSSLLIAVVEGVADSAVVTVTDEGQIAFLRESPVSGDARLTLVSPDDLTTRTLALFDAEGPAVSPDGSRVLVERRGDRDNVWLAIDIESGATTTVLNCGEDPCPDHGTWSPEGRWVALAADTFFVVVDLATGSQRVLVPNRPPSIPFDPEYPEWIGGASWDPEADEIAFECEDRLCVTDAQSGNTRMIRAGEGVANPAHAPRGRRSGWIAFDQDRSSIRMVRRDGSDEITLFSATEAGYRRISDPTWSPDGQRIAFACETGTGDHICIGDVLSGEIEQLPGSEDTSPAWRN